jgi:beta-lactamase class A
MIRFTEKNITWFILLFMRTICCFACCLIICVGSFSQRTDKRLQSQVAALLKNFNGGIGVYVHDLKKNRIVAINADTVFPTASMVKVPILTGIMQKIESGELSYHQSLVYKDSLLYEGVDI